MAEKQATAYVVLEQQTPVSREEEGASALATSTVVVRGQVEARSAQDAIRLYASENGSKAGTFFAVPARSWRPITVAVETQTKLKFS